MTIANGKRAAYTAALSVLDRARHVPRGLKGSELCHNLWLEFVNLVGTATTTDFICGVQLGYDRICTVHLYPPTDTFYPGDSDYTYRVISDEQRYRSTYTDCV
jgi:hypothetical protein